MVSCDQGEQAHEKRDINFVKFRIVIDEELSYDP